jgi:selenide, water dikinase
MAPAELAEILEPIRSKFQASDYPDLLVGLEAADDAAVFRLNDQQAIISTTDFFPPVVDDPYDFGAIAAANALSDIYAMGGQVLFAINLVAFPDSLDKTILREILRGGADKVAEAGGIVVGGHSVNDKEPKYGLAVTGLINPEQVKRKGGARPGDLLVLTKPLGVGVITTALKRQTAAPEQVSAATASMKMLRKWPAKLRLIFDSDSVPYLGCRVLLKMAKQALFPGGWGIMPNFSNPGFHSILPSAFSFTTCYLHPRHQAVC